MTRKRPPIVGDSLVTVEEAASILGMAKSTVYTWASERRIETVKIGRSLRIKRSTLDELITSSVRPALRQE